LCESEGFLKLQPEMNSQHCILKNIFTCKGFFQDVRRSNLLNAAQNVSIFSRNTTSGTRPFYRKSETLKHKLYPPTMRKTNPPRILSYVYKEDGTKILMRRLMINKLVAHQQTLTKEEYNQFLDRCNTPTDNPPLEKLKDLKWLLYMKDTQKWIPKTQFKKLDPEIKEIYAERAKEIREADLKGAPRPTFEKSPLLDDLIQKVKEREKEKASKPRPKLVAKVVPKDTKVRKGKK